jgi:ribose-phosphate pyrophosphokinase
LKADETVNKPITIFAGNSNKGLGDEICEYVGLQSGRVKSSRFSDGEIFVEIGENVRGTNCFIVQSTCSPPNRNLMELLITIDALKRASAGSIVAIIPYFGYARQDRKVKPRTPISAKLVADLLSAAGATRVLSVDLHAGQIQGFFDIPFDHLVATPVIRPALKAAGLCGDDVVVVSPDAGGTERARNYAKFLECSLAIINKRRDKPNQSSVTHLIGDVKGKKAILVDDMIDTAGTLCNAAQAVMDAGAIEVYAAATHGVLSGPAIDRLNESVLKKVWVTNTIPQDERVANCDRLEVLSVGDLIGEAIKRIHHGDSISSLFD